MKLHLSELIQFEKKYNLKNRTILNIKYWDFCRMHYFYETKSNFEKTNFVVDLTRKSKISERKLSINFFKNYFIKHKDYDLLFITDPRRVKQNSRYDSTFVDTITTYLKNDYSIITLEEPSWRAWGAGMPAHFSPTNSTNLKYTDFYEHKFIIKNFFFKMFSKKKIKIINNELNYINKLIFENYNVNLKYCTQEIANIIIYFYLMKKTYTKLIRKINPKIVLLNYRPTYFKVLINSICRENNIKTVDIQHGVIAKEDPLERKNPDGYDFLSTSDYLFAYGEKLVEKTNLCFYKDKIKYVGFPFLENKVKTEIKIPNIIDEEHKYILIISQSIAGNKFADFASDLAEKLKNFKEYKIIFKYHPNKLNKEFKQLNKPNIIQVKNLDYEIYQFQKYSYCQVGAYSTGLFEGLIFQTPTVILKNFPGAQGTLDILKYISKGVYSVNNTEQFMSLLNHLIKPSKKDVNLLWKNNSLNNIKKEINEIFNR